MSPRVLLCAGLLAAAPLSAVELPPGADLRSALELAGDPADTRYGLDGAPPGPRGVVPRAPTQPGSHWLLRYAVDGSVTAWLRFRITGERSETPPLNMSIDRQPPALRWQIEGPHRERDGITLVGRDARLVASADDDSGIDGEVLITSGENAVGAGAEAASDPLGSIPLSLSVSDRLGNRATLGPLPLQRDSEPPTLQARRAKPRDDLAADVVRAGDDPVLIELADAGAGLGRFDSGSTQLSYAGEASASLRLDGVDVDGRYRLADSLGNAAEASLPLRIDADPPQLRLRADGVELDLSQPISLQRSQTVELDAVDEPAGVERACVALSIWYDECRALPLTAIGIAPGRYRLEFRAVDRLGQRAHQYVPLEVLP